MPSMAGSVLGKVQGHVTGSGRSVEVKVVVTVGGGGGGGGSGHEGVVEVPDDGGDKDGVEEVVDVDVPVACQFVVVLALKSLHEMLHAVL